MLVESQYRESLSVATKGTRLGTISTATENEKDGGRKEDVSNTNLDVSLLS